ncbi:hypothetical protein, partial [Lactobacillus helveticus]
RLEENQYKGKNKQPFNDCLILFIYSLSTGFDKEPFISCFLAFNYSKNSSSKKLELFIFYSS